MTLPGASVGSRYGARLVRFLTETGSVYELTSDDEGIRWRRTRVTLRSGILRNSGARLLAWPSVRVGERCRLRSEPYLPQPDPFGRDERLVLTSTVMEILEQAVDDVAIAFDWAKARAEGVFDHRQIDVGDALVQVAGTLEVAVVVTNVDNRFIYVGRTGGVTHAMFDLATGVEVDEELGFGPQFGLVASYLVRRR
jgi:hypothetical protein